MLEDIHNFSTLSMVSSLLKTTSVRPLRSRTIATGTTYLLYQRSNLRRQSQRSAAGQMWFGSRYVLCWIQTFSFSLCSAGEEIRAKTKISQWVDAARKVGEEPHGLKYIFRYKIVTRNTVAIMKRVLGNAIDHELPFPGKEFSMQDEQALALLGTVHGQGVARLLLDHHDQIDSKFSTVYAWTAESDFTEWFMLWTLERP